jgi:hypothetical protein
MPKRAASQAEPVVAAFRFLDGFGIEAQDLRHAAVFVVAKVGSIGI